MSLVVARLALLGLLRRRSRLQRVQGIPSYTKADVIREKAKAALEDFQNLPGVKALSENSREIVCRLFLRNLVLLQVASNSDTEKAERLNELTNKVMEPLLREKPKLYVV